MTTTNTAEALPEIDYDAIKSRQRSTWGSGDYSMIGTTLQIVGEQLCETADLRSGSTVLDIAAGNGNATLAAARRFCRVTSTDYVDSLLERGRLRAEAEGLAVKFENADAEALPYAEDSFDAVISTFGVMFAPRHAVAAQEMARVCRPGGTIAMSNWTPAGYVGRMFATIGRHVAPPAGVAPPSRWGDARGLREILGASADIVEIVPRQFVFRYCSIDHYLDVFRNYFGPIQKAYFALGESAAALDADLRALIGEFNRATDGTVVVPSDYVDVIARPRK